MSYILDALKKAERERGIAKVPTLTTVHNDSAPLSQKRLWILSGLSLAGLAAIAWIGFHLLNRTGDKEQPTRPAAAQAPASSAAIPPAIVPSEGESAPNPPPLAASSPSPQSTREAIPTSPFKATTEAPHTPIASATIRNPEPQSARPDDFEEASEEPPAPQAPAAKSISLHESMARMNMTILMYAEAKSDRVVFINDRKYMEGDYVEGRYLLENITPEGAVLSYQGQRATLRPRAK